MASPLRIRQAVRALILDPHDRVLLVRFEFPSASVWGLPGGGVENDEDPVPALRRELAEELGLVDAPIGPHVWDRTLVVTFEHGDPTSGLGGRWDGQHDRIHMVRTGPFDPDPQLSWEQLRAERVHEMRWWSVHEIATHPGRFAPTRLAEHLTALLRDGPPPTPLDTSDPPLPGN